jgi:hypothetical protein
LRQYEKELLEKPWQVVREGVQVKPLSQAGELYVLAQSTDRVNKERAMRRRQLKGLWQRLQELRRMTAMAGGLASGDGACSAIAAGGQRKDLRFRVAQGQRGQLRAHAPRLTPRSVLEKFAAMQMINVHFPTHQSGWGISSPSGRLVAPCKLQFLSARSSDL